MSLIGTIRQLKLLYWTCMMCLQVVLGSCSQLLSGAEETATDVHDGKWQNSSWRILKASSHHCQERSWFRQVHYTSSIFLIQLSVGEGNYRQTWLSLFTVRLLRTDLPTFWASAQLFERQPIGGKMWLSDTSFGSEHRWPLMLSTCTSGFATIRGISSVVAHKLCQCRSLHLHL